MAMEIHDIYRGSLERMARTIGNITYFSAN